MGSNSKALAPKSVPDRNNGRCEMASSVFSVAKDDQQQRIKFER